MGNIKHMQNPIVDPLFQQKTTDSFCTSERYRNEMKSLSFQLIRFWFQIHACSCSSKWTKWSLSGFISFAVSEDIYFVAKKGLPQKLHAFYFYIFI